MNIPELSVLAKEMEYPCPECGTLTKSMDCRSTMVGSGGSPPGHGHNKNCRTFTFLCTAGHHFKVRPRLVCLIEGCGWKADEHCYVCGPARVRWKGMPAPEPLPPEPLPDGLEKIDHGDVTVTYKWTKVTIPEPPAGGWRVRIKDAKSEIG